MALNGHDRDQELRPHETHAFDKVKSLSALIRLCRSRTEVHELLSLLPMMGDYMRLPNGDDVNLQRVQELRSTARKDS